ncbi:MAG: GGDEF domain-containing protein, partial [Candidatus Methylomirabilis sp.]|nr:GGDEF domain-containing protein [Deltaproteobacteria bacterium]
FKGVNDLYGHLAGDAVLAAVADCCVRVFPSKEELVARFGGDEFAVVVPAGDPKEVLRLGERLLAAVRALRVVHDGLEIPVSVSVGAAVLAPGESADDWTRRADRALYQAKAAGRDRLALAETAGEAAEAA